MVGWWKGDGGTTDALGSFNGALVGNATFAPGKVSQAFSFDGYEDSVMIGNPAGLQLQDFTIEAWIKRASTEQASLDNLTVGHIFGYGYGGYIFALLDDGRLTFGQVGLSGINSTLSIRDTNWHHVAVSKAAGTVAFYVDAVSEAAREYNPDFYFVSSVQIGASQWDGTRPTGSFLGRIDEVSIYNRALAASEVGAIFASGSEGKCAALPPQARALAHWKFDETSGSIANDSAGSHNGTLSSSGAAFVSGGISGGALSLSKINNGFVSMGNVLGLENTDFSIIAWVKLVAGDTSDTVILSKHAAYSRNGYLLIANKTGALLPDDKASFIEGGSGVDAYTLEETPTSTTSVNDGSWHQVAAVFQLGGVRAIYVDGAPAEDAKLSQPFNQNSVAFLIGGANFGGVPTGVFTGLIDEVQVYNYALRPPEVDYLFNHPSQELPPGFRRRQYPTEP